MSPARGVGWARAQAVPLALGGASPLCHPWWDPGIASGRVLLDPLPVIPMERGESLGAQPGHGGSGGLCLYRPWKMPVHPSIPWPANSPGQLPWPRRPREGGRERSGPAPAQWEPSAALGLPTLPWRQQPGALPVLTDWGGRH